MTFAIDTRWGVSLSDKVPESAFAAYGGRWIDQGDLMRADIVPDRQGLAYNNRVDRDLLIRRLQEADPADNTGLLEHDQETLMVNDPDFKVWARRAGGYVYVCAWMEDF